MYNLTEYSDSHLKTSGNLWQCYRDEQFLATGTLMMFLMLITTVLSLILNKKITCKTRDDGTKDLKIMVPVKHLCNFWINFEMPLINFEVNLILTWSANSLPSNSGYQETIFAITIREAKLYVVVVSLSTQDKSKLFQQLKSGFKRAINWNKFQSKITI